MRFAGRPVTFVPTVPLVRARTSLRVAVRRWWLSSSGDITMQGRVLRISLPRVGSSATRDLPAVWDARRTCYRHSHSVRSNSVRPVDSRTSAPAACSCRAASAHPARARCAVAITIRPSSAWSSTSSFSPACSSKGFGMRMPCELPIRTMRDRIISSCIQWAYNVVT